MKTMSEEECRAFVMSGFLPTSNEDIANIQDCFNKQTVDFQIGLLLDETTRNNAERLMRSCLHSSDEVAMFISQAQEIEKRLVLRKTYQDHIRSLEKQIAVHKVYLDETEEDLERYGKYMVGRI